MQGLRQNCRGKREECDKHQMDSVEHQKHVVGSDDVFEHRMPAPALYGIVPGRDRDAVDVVRVHPPGELLLDSVAGEIKIPAA